MASSRAGLKKITKSVRGKKGSVRRSYWVKAQEAAKGAGRFLNRHKGKIAAGAALAGTAALAIHNRGAVKGAYHGARIAHRASGAVSHGMKTVTGSGMSLRNRFNIIRTGAIGGAKLGGAADYLRHNPGVARGARLAGRTAVAAGTVYAARHNPAAVKMAVLDGINTVRDGVSMSRQTGNIRWLGRSIGGALRYGTAGGHLRKLGSVLQ
jgi:hypothetical protein